MSLPFLNKYTHRTSTKESTCFVCGKFTTAVLTHKDIDWFYVCLSHISDTSFCKSATPPQPPVQKTPVVAAQTKEANKKAPQSAADSTKDGKKEEIKGNKEADTKLADNQTAQAATKKEEAVAVPVVQTGPKEYILDSKIFYLRENQYRQKQSVKRAKQVASQFPSVPGNLK